VTGRRPDWKEEGRALVMVARRRGRRKARREGGRMVRWVGVCLGGWGGKNGMDWS